MLFWDNLQVIITFTVLRRPLFFVKDKIQYMFVYTKEHVSVF